MYAGRLHPNFPAKAVAVSIPEVPEALETPDTPDTPAVPDTPATPDPAVTLDASEPPRISRSDRSSARHHVGASTTGTRARFVAICFAAVLGVLILASAVDVAATQGKVHPGVAVGDVSVGSMTPQAARDALSAAFENGSKAPVAVVFGEERWKVTGAQIGARVDTTASITAAMAVGRTGGVLSMVGQRVSALFGGTSVPMLVIGDADKAAPLLNKIASKVAIAAQDASITVEGTSPRLIPAKAGRSLDRDKTLAAINTAFVTRERTGVVVARPMPATVVDADARQALTDAQQLMSGPVRIAFEGKSTTLSREQVAGSVMFLRVPVVAPAMELSSPATASAETTASGAYERMALVAGFEPSRLGQAIATMTAGIGRPARDAAFVATDGSVKITPSQVGNGPDLAGLATDLARACVGTGPREATLRLSETQPKLTTEAARAMGVSDRISTFTTTYSSSNKARVDNVHLLASALDYKLIPPGGIFSFNATAGERTAAKGYQEAPAIVNGKLVPQLGGGVCQVGTTFFNTVFFAGLPVVERRNHSFYISHYPKGRDATVSWGGPDLKFKNDTAGWILIRTAFTNTSLTVSLYGTNPGYTVTYATGAFTNPVPFKVVETKDPKLAKGARVVEDAGITGRRITVVRTVSKGTTVVRTDTFVSTYKPKDEVVRVGTKPSSTPATATVTP